MRDCGGLGTLETISPMALQALKFLIVRQAPCFCLTPHCCVEQWSQRRSRDKFWERDGCWDRYQYLRPLEHTARETARRCHPRAQVRLSPSGRRYVLGFPHMWRLYISNSTTFARLRALEQHRRSYSRSLPCPFFGTAVSLLEVVMI